MATINYAIGQAGTRLPAIELNKGFVLSAKLDCSEENQGAAGIALLLAVPAGTLVDKVVAVVETAEGGTLTFDVGVFDSDEAAVDADGFIDGANGNSAGGNISGDSAEAYANGYYFAAAGYIGLTCVNAADTAVISVSALAYDCLNDIQVVEY